MALLKSSDTGQILFICLVIVLMDCKSVMYIEYVKNGQKGCLKQNRFLLRTYLNNNIALTS